MVDVKRFGYAVPAAILIHVLFLITFLRVKPDIKLRQAPYILLGHVNLPPKVIPKKPQIKKPSPPKVIKKPDTPKPPPPAKAPVEASDAKPQLADLISAPMVKTKVTEVAESVNELDNTDFEPIYNPKPAYPPIARMAEIEGYVVVELLINKKGRVEKYSIIKTEGHQQFALETSRVVRKWRFPPPRINGRPAKVRYEYTVRFVLE